MPHQFVLFFIWVKWWSFPFLGEISINSLNPFRLSPLWKCPLGSGLKPHTIIDNASPSFSAIQFCWPWQLVIVKLSAQYLIHPSVHLLERIRHCSPQHPVQSPLAGTDRKAGQEASVLMTWGHWGRTWCATVPQHITHLPRLAPRPPKLPNHLPSLCQDYRVWRHHSKFGSSFSSWIFCSLCPCRTCN